MTTEELWDTLIHVCILSTVLSILYWTIIEPVSEKALKREVNNAISKAIEKLNVPPAPLVRKSADFLDKPLELMEDQDPVTAQNNKVVKFANVAVVLVMWIALFGGSWIMQNKCGMEIPMKKLLVVNVVLFGIIGIVEYMFFSRVGQKFAPIAPSTVASLFLENVRKKLE